MTDKPNYTQISTQKTGGEPVEGADPGGTHSTKPGKRTPDGKTAAEQTTSSGDRNPYRESRTGIPSKQ